jgi:putative membrane protein
MPGLTARRAAAVAAAILLVGAAGSCKGRQGSDMAAGRSDTGTMSGMRSDTGSAMSSRDTTSGMAATSSGTLSDANIVFLLDEANMADSATAAYALTRATNAEVKKFAKMMMGEHHALRVQGQQLAKRLNVTPEPVADDPFKPAVQSEMTALKAAAKGAAFDRTYIQQEIGIHKAVVDVAGKAHDQTQTEQLKKLIEQAKPIIEKHLNAAEAIQKKLGTPSA